MGRKLIGLLVCSALVFPVLANASSGNISGLVRNSTGSPQMGAVVEIFSAARTAVTLVTDAQGFYQTSELPAGKYQVKVSAPSYLPTLREDLSLKAGASLVVNVTLNTLFEALDMLPSLREAAEEDDWNWTLRSAANRPIFRVLDDGPVVVESASEGWESAENEGPNRSLKAKVAFMAGSEADGFGSAGDMTTRFNVERSLFSSGTFAVGGDLGNTSGLQGVLRASYTHQMANGSSPELALTVHRFATPATVLPSAALEAMELTFSDTLRLGDSVSLKLGSELQSVQFARRISAWRPFGSLDIHLSPNTVLQYQYVTSVPNTRAAKGYDSAPTDLSESEPRISLKGRGVALQRARHHEISLSRRWGANRFQVAAYQDHVHDAALTGASAHFMAFPGILPDIYSGTFSYNAGNLDSRGFRIVAEREVAQGVNANVTYSYGGVLDLGNTSREWNGLSFREVRRHSVSGSLSGEAPHAGTRWIASYRWTGGQALGMVDMFNNAPGRSDPFFNLFVRQPLPQTGLLPGRFEALVDLRNLLAQGYIPVVGPDGRTVFLVQSARSVRGGLAFVF
ncbi:MAG: carboxypeptidase regulatory-like domain-containing protein [Candidatus Korobacteraceae bacterium]